MIEQAHHVFMHVAYSVGYHWEKGRIRTSKCTSRSRIL